MIYSEKYNFLLLKNYKVGGTSLEIELSQLLKDSDAIITKIYPDHTDHISRNNRGYYNHMSYKEVEEKIGKQKIDRSESVVFVRNPFETVLSHMYMSARWSGITGTVDESVTDKYFSGQLALDKLTGLKTRQIYSLGNRVSVKHVLKYEDGIKSINPILSNLGIETVTGHYNEKTYKPKTISPADIFKDRHLDTIRNDWSWEFAEFDYSMDMMYNG